MVHTPKNTTYCNVKYSKIYSEITTKRLVVSLASKHVCAILDHG